MMSLSHFNAHLILSVALLGCSQTATQTTSEAIAKPQGPALEIGNKNPTEAESLNALLSEAVSVLNSETFRSNILKLESEFPKIYISHNNQYISPTALLETLNLNTPKHPNLRWGRTTVDLVGKAVRDSDPYSTSKLADGFLQDDYDTDRDASVNCVWKPNGDCLRDGTMSLGRVHLARYVVGDTVEKSCAINTAAHEISHTLSGEDWYYLIHFVDTDDINPAPARTFKASYFIGTVAQCTWLQEQGRIGPDDLYQCVVTFGDPTLVDPFQARACNDFPDLRTISPANRYQPPIKQPVP